MFPRLLILFIGIPLLEILILIELSDIYGFWPTVLLVIVTGILGASLARLYGVNIWLEIRNELAAGRVLGRGDPRRRLHDVEAQGGRAPRRGRDAYPPRRPSARGGQPRELQ